MLCKAVQTNTGIYLSVSRNLREVMGTFSAKEMELITDLVAHAFTGAVIFITYDRKAKGNKHVMESEGEGMGTGEFEFPIN